MTETLSQILDRLKNSIKKYQSAFRIFFHQSDRKTFGRNIKIGKNVDLNVGSKGHLIIENNCWLGDYSKLITHDGYIHIGKNSFVGHFCVLYGHGGLKIGDYVMIAAHTVIIPANHNYSRTDIPIKLQGGKSKGIEIENDVWIGANVTILDGIKIRRGAVIGAGSVVNKDVEAYNIVAGNPARVVSNRSNLR